MEFILIYHLNLVISMVLNIFKTNNNFAKTKFSEVVTKNGGEKMKVNCDECKKDFELKIEIEKIKNDVERTFFTCPNCNKQYTPALTNERIRNEQTLMRKYIKEFESIDSVGRRLFLAKKIDNLREKIDKDIAWLKEKYNY